MTRLAAGVLGKNLDVDNTKAKQELNWESRINLSDAMDKITRWVNEVYLAENQNGNQ